MFKQNYDDADGEIRRLDSAVFSTPKTRHNVIDQSSLVALMKRTVTDEVKDFSLGIS